MVLLVKSLWKKKLFYHAHNLRVAMVTIATHFFTLKKHSIVSTARPVGVVK